MDLRRRRGWIAALASLVAPLSASARAEPPPALAVDADADADARALRGRVLQAGDRAPVAGATVLLLPEADDQRPGPARAESVDPELDPAQIRRTETDDAGAFTADAPEGARVRVVVMAAGFRRLDEVVARDRERPGGKAISLFLYPDTDDPYRTVVTSRKEPEPDDGGAVRRSLQAEELDTVPGAWGDPLLALQNMPGFARTPAGVGAVIIRGGAPRASQVFLGEHPVPRAFHTLPFTSVVPAAFVKRLDYEPGNFGARYGDATVGVVRVLPRVGGQDGVHGHAQLSLTSVGAAVEGPLGPGSFLVAARRGYADAVLHAINEIGDTAFARPSYYDYQAMFDANVRPGETLGVHVLGSGDTVRVDSFGRVQRYRSDFHRLDLEYRRRLGPYRVLISPAFRFDVGGGTQTQARAVEGSSYATIVDLDVRRHDYNALLRAELARRWSRAITTTLGADAQIDPYRVAIRTTDDALGEVLDEEVRRGAVGALGLYAQAELELGPLRVVPATRLSGFFVGGRGGFSVDPRLRLTGRVGERWTLMAAIGKYSRAGYDADSLLTNFIPYAPPQVPGAPQIISQIAVPSAYRQLVEPELELDPIEDTFHVERALHTSAGVEVAPNDDWSLGLVGFTRTTVGGTQVFGGAPGAATVVQTAGERAFGLEFVVRRALTRKLYGWLVYSLLWAEQLARVRGFPAARVPADFDQRHNLNLVLSYRLPKGWRVGGRFRLSSGIPYTPIVGSREVFFGFLPILGRRNSERYPWFHQLDLRVDKRWLLRRVAVTAYLDVQNVYGGQPVEFYAYSEDYRVRRGFPTLPILPVFGLRVDY